MTRIRDALSRKFQTATRENAIRVVVDTRCGAFGEFLKIMRKIVTHNSDLN